MPLLLLSAGLPMKLERVSFKNSMAETTKLSEITLQSLIHLTLQKVKNRLMFISIEQHEGHHFISHSHCFFNDAGLIMWKDLYLQEYAYYCNNIIKKKYIDQLRWLILQVSNVFVMQFKIVLKYDSDSNAFNSNYAIEKI